MRNFAFFCYLLLSHLVASIVTRRGLTATALQSEAVCGCNSYRGAQAVAPKMLRPLESDFSLIWCVGKQKCTDGARLVRLASLARTYGFAA